MAEEKKVTQDLAAATGGAAPQSAVPTDKTVADKPKDEGVSDDADGNILNPPWYRRIWARIAAVGRWIWRFWWLWLIIVLVAAAAVAAYYIFFAGNGEDGKAPIASKTAVVAPATVGLTNPDATSAMASASEERLGKVEETLKSTPPTAASAPTTGTVTVDQAQWISQCVSFGGTAEGCKLRLEKLRVR